MNDSKPSPTENSVTSNFSYNSGQLPAIKNAPDLKNVTNQVEWSASEFIAHQKGASWYFILAAGTVIVAALIFFLTREYISAGVVAVLGLTFGIYGSVPPRNISYKIDSTGITVEKKHFPFESFKGVQITEGGVVPSITFIPLKRFTMPLTIYFSPQQKDQITNMVGEFLPSEVKQIEKIDKLVARLRF
jgi:hypothetical protein